MESFQGFEEKGHVALIGSTNSGKTTSMVTNLLSNLFFNFDIFVLVGSDLMTAKQMEPLRKAICYLKKGNCENIFAYYKTSQASMAIDYMINTDREKSKLCFFDDSQLNGARNINEIGNFVNQAKNADCTVVIALHQAYEDKAEMKIKAGCRYIVLYNQNEMTFNKLLGLQKGNQLWRKYAAETDKYKRVLIYDVENKKAYSGIPPYERMDPLINAPLS